MSSHKFVFIGGLHKSGTSILFQCLREHPLISGFRNTGAIEDEGQHLQSVYPPAIRYGGPGKFGFHPDAHLTEASGLVSEENAGRLFEDWTRFWDLGRPILLEKSPPNLIRSRFLQALFPNSYFLIVMRHPIAVSYATQRWSKTSLDSLLEHWLVCHKRFEQDRQHIRRLFVLKYEDFAARPQGLLDQIYSFLDVQSYSNQLTVVDANPRYLMKWRRYGTDLRSIGFLRKPLTLWRYERQMNRFGYSLEE